MNREPNEPESWTPPTRRWTYLKPRIDSESFTHDGKQMCMLGQTWQKLLETTEDRMGNTLRREANGKDKRKITWWETNKGNRKQMKEYLHRGRHLRWSSARHSESGREMKGEFRRDGHHHWHNGGHIWSRIKPRSGSKLHKCIQRFQRFQRFQRIQV